MTKNMTLQILKRLIILSAIIKFTNGGANPESATSRVQFIQYQPANSVKINAISSTQSTPSAVPQESRLHSNIFVDVNRAFGRKQDEPLHTDVDQQSSVPKNYAFAYAIRDRDSGDDYSHTQAHSGKATKGQYRVKLPDGRTQVVTYTADNGGYRADIRYDKDNNPILLQEQASDNSGAYNLYSNERVSPSSNLPVINQNNANNFRKTSTKPLANKAPPPDSPSPSPLLYFNEIRSFGVTTTGRPSAASYETVEHVDEEQLPYDKKLIDDVNYLLRYVTPTIETQTENVFDITPDKLFNNHPTSKPRPATAAGDNNNIFELPADFPYKRFQQLDDKKFEALDKKLYFPRDPHSNTAPNFVTPKTGPTHRLITPKYDQQKPESHERHFTPQFEFPQSNQRAENREQEETPNYETQRQQHQQPQFYSTPADLEPRDSPPSSTPKYHSRDSPLFNIVTETRPLPPAANPSLQYNLPDAFNPLIRSQPRQHSPPYSPNYDSREPNTFSTPKYQPEEENPPAPPPNFSTTPKYQPSSPSTSDEFESRQHHQQPSKPSHHQFRPSQPFVPRHHKQSNEKSPLFSPHPQQEKFNSYPSPIRSQVSRHYNSDQSNATPPEPVDYPAVSPGPKFNSREYPAVAPVPAYSSDEQPPVSPVTPREEFRTSTPTVPLFRPTAPTPEEKPRSSFGKIEIPQYLHIHRYEDSGEDAKPKELIYYTPLQIPVPNSIAYMERGNYSTRPALQTVGYSPNYITMTEHPRNQAAAVPPESNYLESPANLTSFNPSDDAFPTFRTIDNSKHLHPSRQTAYKNPDYLDIAVPLNTPLSAAPPQVTSGENSGELQQQQHLSHEHSDDHVPYFDPRTYSGYFDFMPSAEINEDKAADYRESEREPDHNEETSSSPLPPSQKLPQYYYDYATATPSHRYISSGEITNSHESAPSVQDDPIRNSTFRASAYLRPLHKERVYIHHNSQPTTPSGEDPFTSFATSPRPLHSSSGDVSIVKSISSSIPPELLKDFDYQLSNSIFRADSLDDGSELAKVTLPSGPATTTRDPILSNAIAQKLQSVLATKGRVYLKTAAHQKRNVR